MKKTVEQLVSEAVLQKNKTVVVGKKTYNVAPPTIATLIMVSEAISFLPHTKLDEEHVVEDVLHYAKDCRVLGDIAAILILGAQTIKEAEKSPQTEEKRRLWGLFNVREVVDVKKQLANEILDTMSPKELTELITQLLQGMQLSDFFGLTTFLAEINLLRTTKVG